MAKAEMFMCIFAAWKHTAKFLEKARNLSGGTTLVGIRIVRVSDIWYMKLRVTFTLRAGDHVMEKQSVSVSSAITKWA